MAPHQLPNNPATGLPPPKGLTPQPDPRVPRAALMATTKPTQLHAKATQPPPKAARVQTAPTLSQPKSRQPQAETTQPQSTTQPPSANDQLEKPAQWPMYMVAAAVKYASHAGPWMVYTTQDTACQAIMDCLNRTEVQCDYHWPNFVDLGFDFVKAMQLRHTLVSDVFEALYKAGVVKVGAAEQAEANRKRRRLEKDMFAMYHSDGLSSDTDYDDMSAFGDVDMSTIDDNKFLAKTMRKLIYHTGIDVATVFKKGTAHDPHLISRLIEALMEAMF